MGFMVCHLVVVVCVLVAVGFFTLFERKVLAAAQLRKGPDKVGIGGVAQPVADAVKLFLKESTRVEGSNEGCYWAAPGLSLLVAVVLWEFYPLDSAMVYFMSGVLLFLSVSSLNVYTLILAGWASNSKYALLGAMRAVAQTVSYEVCMGLILLVPLFLSSSLAMAEVSWVLRASWVILLCPSLFFVWMSCVFAETNRAPFDFAEGESELVSGFNVEYSAVGFSLIFMAEYANILFMSVLTACLFCGGSYPLGSGLVLILKSALVGYVVVWARATLPRFRYDLLMYLTWKGFLPSVLSMLIFSVVAVYLGGS
uniref:NADH dehydrogenase subunit 1 n=1 Tax=Patelloida saccharinoides TaxID=225156 RepID=UPI0023D848FF|nr:NADH dehydrogenase subunit 1 [Patelloida saccharinoides]WCR50871.1 NADH dehydrogenase subunit 1 [Patelloida saccharinoides]